MSLIGSLEDLSLGDILQIISLSQKSGVLLVRTDGNEGRVLFRNGAVCGASIKGGPTDLRSIVVGGGFVGETQFDEAERCAVDRRSSVEDALVSGGWITSERVESLRRETVESAVAQIFRWSTGEFSFDVREACEADDPPALVPTGMNAQYLAMEAARHSDEGERETETAHPEEELSAHAMFGVAEPGAESFADEDIQFGTTADEFDGSDTTVAVSAADLPDSPDVGDVPDLTNLRGGPDPAAAAEVLALATAEAVALRDAELPDESDVQEPATAPEVGASAAPANVYQVPLVVIDPDLRGLEWTKQALGTSFNRVHIFQRGDLGLTRIRQYLARATVPCVLVSPALEGDPMVGIRDASDFIRRLKLQAPGMRVLWIHDESDPDEELEPRPEPGPEDPAAPADAHVGRPDGRDLESAEAAAGQALCAGVAEVIGGAAGLGPGATAATGCEAPDDSMERLKEVAARLRDASTRGEVLPLVMDFAAEHFARVAMLLLQGDEVVGIARAGHAGIEDVALAVSESAWLRGVMAGGGAGVAAPDGAGDECILSWLGRARPDRAYLAPVVSSGRVVALLYGDLAPAGGAMPDTSSLEVALQHAGLALERAVLERALAEG